MNQKLPPGISIRHLEENMIVITQDEIINGKIYNQKQLHKLAKEFYPDSIVKPNTFSLSTANINPDFIKYNMEKYGIKPKDLVKQLAIPKSKINSILKNKVNMNSIEKALFYYYFLTLEISKL